MIHVVLGLIVFLGMWIVLALLFGASDNNRK